ncbi:4'-phosphopantetheinyl transferase superfamily protein [Pedobacter sp. PAMC26386]|nr:4'-phosphopantetheinyl transferase superfamily protein [Pedobacter sp. PAMC26386]
MSGQLFCQFNDSLPICTFHPELTGNEILIWDIDTDLYLTRIALLKKVLSIEEKDRADRFHFERDSNRFIVRRAILKILLAAYKGCGIKHLKYIRGTNGKPQLAGNNELNFNTSHSNNHAIIALSRHQIGVDLEFINPDFDIIPVAEFSFSADEFKFLAGSSNPLKDFFITWTRKEAFVKATGSGLNDHLQHFSCLNGRQLIPAQLQAEEADWNLDTVELSQEYLLSIAARVTTEPLQSLLVNFNEDLLHDAIQECV